MTKLITKEQQAQILKDVKAISKVVAEITKDSKSLSDGSLTHSSTMKILKALPDRLQRMCRIDYNEYGNTKCERHIKIQAWLINPANEVEFVATMWITTGGKSRFHKTLKEAVEERLTHKSYGFSCLSEHPLTLAEGREL